MSTEPIAEPSTLRQVVVVGGGVAGTRTANLLARKLHGRGVVELITASPMHVYTPGLVYIPFEDVPQVETSRPEVDLLRPELVVAAETPAVRVDRDRRCVLLANGREVAYDYLVLATGTESDPDGVPGLVGTAHSFQTPDEGRRLRAALRELKRGRVVVGLANENHPDPAAPIEFAFLLADYVRRWGLEKQTEIVLTCPSGQVFPDVRIASRLRRRLEERFIGVRVDFVPAAVSGQTLHSVDGRKLPFDLLVMEAPRRGVAAIRDSGLGDPHGLLTCDPHNLRVVGESNTWAVGECSSLGVGRWPSAGLHQAAVVAAEIVAEIGPAASNRPEIRYDGRCEILLDLGQGAVSLVTHSYPVGYTLHAPTPILATGKRAVSRAYWQLGPTGRI